MPTNSSFVSLVYDGSDNLPGVRRAFAIRVADIQTFAAPVANPTTGLEQITLVGNFVPKTGKYFAEMYNTQGKGALNFESGGSRDFEHFKKGSELFFPSTKKEALAMVATVKGQDCIVIFEENSENDGYYLAAGTQKLAARLTASGDWGTNLDGEKGITFKMEAFHGTVPMFVYDGTIPLSATEVINS